MTRIEKWKSKRLEMENDRRILAIKLANAAEELLDIHSEIRSKVRDEFDTIFGNPVEIIDSWFGTRNVEPEPSGEEK